jgi:beta-lactamase class A
MATEREILQNIAREMETLPGHVGFYYQNLITGFSFGLREQESYLAASVIKFPIYLHILAEAEKGNLSLNEKLHISDADKMPGCGALSLLTGEQEIDIAALCRLMICISDNTATNVLIRRCGISEINRGFREMGLEKTLLRRYLFDSEASARGLENTICPREMSALLERLYRKEFISPTVSETALNTLLHQQVCHKLEGKLCGSVDVAHKTGEDENLSNDVGIVFAEEPFILCFAGHGTDVYPWEDLIRRAAYDLCRK